MLPALGHLRGPLPQTGSMRHSLRLLSEESAEERAGSSFARRQYGRLLLLEILRTYAGTARMSGTAFAVRFRAAAGVPPHAYLTRWRMLLARRALAHDEVTVAALATQLGYGSESSFSHAFKREVGEPPLRYRTRGEHQN
ncbi:AraC family transcriptional regulator [Streptomyces ambofaciens]